MNGTQPESFPPEGKNGRPYGPDIAMIGSGTFAELFRQGMALLRRNYRLIAAIMVISMVVSVVLTMLDTPRYTAVTSVQINDQSEQVLGDELENANEVNVAADVDRFLNTQVDILRSRGLAQRVAQRLTLFTDDQFFAATEVDVPDSTVSEAARREKVLSLLHDNMMVNLPRNSRIVELQFSSANPRLSAEIVNTFAEEFIQANLKRRFDSSAYARNFIAEQLEEARVRLESSERELNAYAREAGLIRTRNVASDEDNSSAGSSITTSSLMQINEAANRAKADRIEAEGRWLSEKAVPPLSSHTVLANPTVQNLMTKRSELATAYDAAKERYLPDHPSVLQAAAELRTVNAQLAQVVQNVRDSVKAEYDAAVAAEQRLQAQVNELQGATLAEQDLAVRYNTLAREADTNRSLYEGLLQRYRELNAAAGIANSNLAIIDRADAPLKPSSPRLFVNLAIAMVMGGLLAVVVVFIRSQLDDAVRVPEDVEEQIGLPLLGVVPLADEDESPSEALAQPKSAISEAYGSLRGALLYSTRSGLPTLLQVTSTLRDEGKSTTSSATASGFARMGRRTLLLDSDMRRPSVHRLIGYDNRRGLSSLLVSNDDVASAIVPSGQENLDLLPSGPIPPSPTELLTSPRMAQLMNELADKYDVVIIDSPPVLGLADAPAIAALADGVMFVVEAERCKRGALKAALKRLQAVNSILLGAVLTKFDPDKAGNRYSEYYGYNYYRYGADDEVA